MKGPEKKAGNTTVPVYKSKVYPHLWYSLLISKGSVNDNKVYETTAEYLGLFLFTSSPDTVVTEVSQITSNVKERATYLLNITG